MNFGALSDRIVWNCRFERKILLNDRSFAREGDASLSTRWAVEPAKFMFWLVLIWRMDGEEWGCANLTLVFFKVNSIKAHVSIYYRRREIYSRTSESSFHQGSSEISVINKMLINYRLPVTRKERSILLRSIKKIVYNIGHEPRAMDRPVQD